MSSPGEPKEEESAVQMILPASCCQSLTSRCDGEHQQGMTKRHRAMLTQSLGARKLFSLAHNAAAKEEEEAPLREIKMEIAPAVEASTTSNPEGEQKDVAAVEDMKVDTPATASTTGYVKDETDCFRHGIVDVPALMELLRLIGACPICKRKLDIPKVDKDEHTGIITTTLRCHNRACGFLKNWCSSPSSFSDPAVGAQ